MIKRYRVMIGTTSDHTRYTVRVRDNRTKTIQIVARYRDYSAARDCARRIRDEQAR